MKKYETNIVVPKIGANKLVIPKINASKINTTKLNKSVINVVTPKINQVTKVTQVMPKINAITPKVNSIKDTIKDEDPWACEKIPNADNIKFIAMTPLGRISLVPTSKTRPPATPRRLVPSTPKVKLKIIDKREDPILSMSLYFPNPDKNFTNKMSTIGENIKILHKQFKNKFRPCINISGFVSEKQYEEILSIYENNQVYYQDRIDEKDMDSQIIHQQLTLLEHWFVCIIEPKPKDYKDILEFDEWKERELHKIEKGISAHCDPELYSYIDKIPNNALEFVKNCLKTLKIL